MRKSQAKLTLVGAGPGDPDLISIKGANAIAEADVLLYDALVHPDLLRYATDRALKIFVGKRSGKHSVPQDEINQMIVEYAYTHGHVVRLKGGDPFVFGRGAEEIAFAENFDIETAIIPGISSATSLSGLQKIPLTKRGVSESFWVVTATTIHGKFSHDVKLAAQSTATVVILMGLKKLGQIVEVYRQLGQEETPIAIIQSGSLPEEKLVIGSISDIEELAAAQQIGTPAIMVIGEVVKDHPEHVYEYVTAQVQASQNR